MSAKIRAANGRLMNVTPTSVSVCDKPLEVLTKDVLETTAYRGQDHLSGELVMQPPFSY